MSELFPTEVWKASTNKRRQYRPFIHYISYQRIGFLTAITDFALILATSIAIGVAYSFFAFETDGSVEAFAFLGCYSALLFVLWANALGLYRPKAILSASSQIRGVIVAWGAV